MMPYCTIKSYILSNTNLPILSYPTISNTVIITSIRTNVYRSNVRLATDRMDSSKRGEQPLVRVMGASESIINKIKEGNFLKYNKV